MTGSIFSSCTLTEAGGSTVSTWPPRPEPLPRSQHPELDMALALPRVKALCWRGTRTLSPGPWSSGGRGLAG